MAEPITRLDVDHYIEALVPARDPVLAAVEQHAFEHRLPIVGPAEGHLLWMLARLAQPKRLLELGCCTGYSALWLAGATASTSARIETIELDEARAQIASEHFARSPHGGRIALLRGDAREILPTLESGAYDLIFNDLLRSGAGETNGVPNQVLFLEHSVRLLAPGGLLLSDNVLCGGEVTAASPASVASGIAAYNRALADHPEMDSAMVPIRDGVTISLKRGGSR